MVKQSKLTRYKLFFVGATNRPAYLFLTCKPVHTIGVLHDIGFDEKIKKRISAKLPEMRQY